MTSKIKILDCTLRDGGYYNNWDFSEKLYKKYFEILTKQEGINCIEIGFRSIDSRNYNGPFAFSKDSFINSKKFPKFNYAVMVNASELIKLNKTSLRKIFLKNSKIKIVRVAAHFHEISKITKHLIYLKDQGYKVFLNIMQINFVSETDLINMIKKLNTANNIDVLYFADSLGNLISEDVKRICNTIKKYWSGEFGFHAHDNIGMALKNSKTACKYGATWIDGTIQGMGRGAGNVKTENLLKKILKLKNNKIKKNDIITIEFKRLKKEYKWGKSKLYNFAAKNNIHPTYVQKINEKQFSEKKSFKLLKDISLYKNAKSFNFENLNKILVNSNLKNSFFGKTLKDYFKDKNILILANGPSLKSYTSELNYFIKLKKTIVFSLNFNNYINNSLIDYYLISHFESYVFLEDRIKILNKKLIVPTNVFKNFKVNFSNKNFIDYGILLKQNTFVTKNNHCILPNNLAFTYALAIAQIGKAKQIYLAGFDGYDQNVDKLLEMDKTINLFKRKFTNRNLISITPTKYNFLKKSIHAY